MATRQTATKRKKRKKKYKVHYDRLIAQLCLLALIVFVVVWVISLFRGDDGLSAREASREAVEAGRRDAEKVLHTAPGSMERDNALLFIKARENELRSEGYGHAADDYIDAARTYLNEKGIK